MTKLIEFKNHRGSTLRGLLNTARSSRGVLFVHGLERSSTEYKFKHMVDRLSGKVNLFRFDFSGCGISDGSFADLSSATHVKEIHKAIAVFKKNAPSLKEISIVAHSFGCCSALKYVDEHPKSIKKLALLGPAFNQRELHKYFYVSMTNRDKKITWTNFNKYFSESGYRHFVKKFNKLSKAHYFGQKYYKENIDRDYQDLFEDLKFSLKDILIVQGDKDSKVPPTSNDKLPKELKNIMVKGGDHDFQKMNMVPQYLPQLIRFITK